MSEFEPIADKQATVEKAAKLREMTQSRGWREVLVPELQQGIAEQKEILAASEFTDLLDVRLNQERIKFAQEIIDRVARIIKEADQIQHEEAMKVQEQGRQEDAN